MQLNAAGRLDPAAANRVRQDLSPLRHLGIDLGANPVYPAIRQAVGELEQRHHGAQAECFHLDDAHLDRILRHQDREPPRVRRDGPGLRAAHGAGEP